MEKVILVDEDDNAIGSMDKMEAHRQGKLHRAFSVVLYNAKGEMLLQKRAANKYHSAGLWTNACCSHPKPDEPVQLAARRRLNEEMGIDANPAFAYKFIYRAELECELVEYEYDHVFVGTFEGEPQINPNEVAEWKYANVDWLRQDVKKNAERYTFWFKLILEHPAAAPATIL
ncbi:MAG TPA: isopentenyl-diphosphate Delta-isomerase [Chryseosolibacter sp.]|nr:isopentenyl-diphosphate Delta-isomerase [Chryseosolibacter sp.]